MPLGGQAPSQVCTWASIQHLWVLCDAHTQNTQHFSFRCGPYPRKSHETQPTNTIAVSQPYPGPHPISVLPSLQGESSCMRVQLAIPSQDHFGQACGWWLCATDRNYSALLLHMLTVRGCAGADRAIHSHRHSLPCVSSAGPTPSPLTGPPSLPDLSSFPPQESFLATTTE